MKRIWKRLVAAGLSLALLLLPAQALTVEEAKDLLREYYVDPVPEEALAADTMEELLENLGDPYTQYFTPEEYAAFWASMSDVSLVGVGIVASMAEDGVLVEEVLQNSPAQAGGLAAGDVIVQVDGQDAVGQTLDDVVAWLKGEEDTQVEVTYLREGEKHTVTLTRAAVTVPATTGRLLDGQIGYIQCTTWGSETLGHFEELLEEMREQASLWVVDLRGNTGGLTDAAVDVAELFCGEGNMLLFRYGDGSYEIYRGDDPAVTQAPLLVLVDEYTASASEAFCAAVRDYGRGILIGARTYGKGVAQGVWDKDSSPALFPDGDAFKLTVARFFSPADSTNDEVGILPHLLVPGEYALDVARLMGESPQEGAETFTFGLDGEEPIACTVSLEHLDEDPAWTDVYEALLSALPPDAAVLVGGEDGSVTPQELAERLGLTLTNDPFPDVAESPYASAIHALKTYRLIEGNEKGQFLPQNSLTRAELCQILYRALQCAAPTGEGEFSDVAQDAWYAQAVDAIAQWGLVEGDGQGRFHPEDVLDHQQLFTILGRLAAWLNCELADQAAAVGEDEVSLRVLANYADWAKAPVWLLSCGQEVDGAIVNLLWDEPEVIDPEAPATREETADLLYAVLHYLLILP